MTAPIHPHRAIPPPRRCSQLHCSAPFVTASTCTNGRHDRFKRNCGPHPTRVSLRLSRVGLSQRERRLFVTGDGPTFVGLCHLCKTHRALSQRLRMVAESTSLKGQVLVPRVLSQPGVFRKQEGFMSKTSPVADNKTAGGREQNRRVEVRVLRSGTGVATANR